MRFRYFDCAIVGLLATIVVWTTPASAQQFCSGPLTPTDGAICESPMLSALNNEIADLYVQAINRAYADGGPADAIKHQHSTWMRSMRDCGGDVACIEGSMASRKSVLQAMLPKRVDVEASGPIELVDEEQGPTPEAEGVVNQEVQANGAAIEAKVPAENPAAEQPGGASDTVLGVLGIAALAVTVFALSAGLRALKTSKAEYGYDLVFNWAGLGSVAALAILILGLLTGPGMLMALPAALICFGLAAAHNVKRTNLRIGLIGTAIQPFILIITVAGIYWLANASRRIATGDRQGL